MQEKSSFYPINKKNIDVIQKIFVNLSYTKYNFEDMRNCKKERGDRFLNQSPLSF